MRRSNYYNKNSNQSIVVSYALLAFCSKLHITRNILQQPSFRINMRTIITRSAQKKLASEPATLAKKPISKAPLKPKTAAASSRLSASKNTTVKSPSSQTKSIDRQSQKPLIKKVLPPKNAKVISSKSPKVSAVVKAPAMAKRSPSKVLVPKVSLNKPQQNIVKAMNPESPSTSGMKPNASRGKSNSTKGKRLHDFSVELQSQDSTSFEAQSARGGDIAMETLPSLATELENLPKIKSVSQFDASEKAGSTRSLMSPAIKHPQVTLQSSKLKATDDDELKTTQGVLKTSVDATQN